MSAKTNIGTIPEVFSFNQLAEAVQNLGIVAMATAAVISVAADNHHGRAVILPGQPVVTNVSERSENPLRREKESETAEVHPGISNMKRTATQSGKV